MTYPGHHLCTKTSKFRVHSVLAALTLSLGLLGGCASGLLPKPQMQPTLLSLDTNAHSDAVASTPAASASVSRSTTLIIDTPRAAAGYDTRNIAYLRRAHEIEYFALHQWVDAPAKMLAPLMMQALQRSGTFGAVALAPTGASGDLRLETELIRLQQDFRQSPSRVQLTLRAMLIDTATRRVLGWREFNITTVSSVDDPYGGAAAAGQATDQMLVELVAFCGDTTAGTR